MGSQAVETSNPQTVSERSGFSYSSFSLFVDTWWSSLDYFVKKPVFSPRKFNSKIHTDPNKQIQGELLCFPEDLAGTAESPAFVHSLVSVHRKSCF